LIFAFVIPEIVHIVTFFSEKYGLFINKYFNGFHMHFVLGFTGYFILGYYLNNIAISKKAERIIYALGVLGFAYTVLMSAIASLIKNEPFVFFGNNTVNVLF
ncbi:MAG: hypothetical protein IJG34_08220, partial [Synergistaceae bacterium]|nr:hypothetical protein [Synergistaceae bacterium]